jgi:hypothetical protein|tara:strand:- start:3398 stop:4801 length:1404 start_codon:yes stop_codon:yes gene_type:complete
MENLNLIFSSESIRNSFYERENEKNILQFPFFFESWSEINFKIENIADENIIAFRFDTNEKIENICKKLEHPLPEIFNCREIQISCNDGLYYIRNLDDFLKSKKITNSVKLLKKNDDCYNEFEFRLVKYGSRRFNALFNQQSMLEFFKTETSLNYLGQNKSLKIYHFANQFTIKADDLFNNQKKEKNFKNKTINAENFKLQISIWNNLNQNNNKKELTVLFNDLKINVSRNKYFLEIKNNLLNHFQFSVPQFDRFISFELIFNIKDLVLDEKFNIVNNDDFKANIKNISTTIKSSIGTLNTKSIIDHAEELALKLQAQKLNTRKQKLRESQKVYVDDILLSRVPTNEQETVLLFIKLASLKKTPLNHANILEYSASEGIDAIADIQLDKSVPTDKDCLVEFEPTFSQFKTHRHPPKHVDYIICWSIEEHWKKKLLKNKNWLYYFKLDKFPKAVKVIEIKNFDQIKIK